MKLKTKKLRYVDRVVVASVLLGLFALGTNSIAIIFDSSRSIPAGNIFSILGAIALGPVGGVIAGTLGLIPRSFMTGEYFDSLRLVLFLVAVGYAAKRWKEVPAFLVMGALWVVTAPLSILVFHQSTQTVALVAASEIMITLFCSTLLLHRGLWGSLTTRPRHTELKDVFVYGAASIMASGYAAGCVLFWSVDPARFGEHAIAITFLGLTLMTLVVVTLRGVAARLQENISHYVPRVLAQNTFSGLSSTNWRRPQNGAAVDGKDFPDGAQLAKEWNTVTNARSKEASREGIIAISGEDTISFVNRAFRSCMEEHDPNLLGKKLDAVPFAPEVRSALTELIASARLGNEKNAEVKLNRLPDKLRFLEFNAIPGEQSPHASLNSGPNSVVISVKDISDRRTVEDHLLQGQRLASLGATVKGLAHSLNNYLTSISGHVSFARHAEEETARITALNDALDATREAGALIRRLLDFAESRPGALRTVNLTNLMHSQLDLISRLLGTDVNLSVDVSDEPVGTNCDPQMLTQAITNVVINAKESLPENGIRKIEISLQAETIHESVAAMIPGGRAGEFARLTIKDSGCGMKHEVLTQAFEPLFTTKQHMGNAGLGLSMVYAIVRAHDGFMSIETNPGKGTACSIYLPVQDWADDSLGAQLALVQNDSVKPVTETVLVVEDDPAVRDVVTQMLRTLGYSVQSCSNGPEALKICSDKTFDIALVDMMMPHMSGTELVQKIHALSDKTKTLVMTGYGARSEDLEALRTLVIPKPFDIETLSEFISQSLSELEVQETPDLEAMFKASV